MIRNRNPLGTLWQEFNQVQDEFTKWLGHAAHEAQAAQPSRLG